jgi:hypothetical protein
MELKKKVDALNKEKEELMYCLEVRPSREDDI